MKTIIHSLIVTVLFFSAFNVMAQTSQQTRESLVTECVENERRIYEKDGGMFFHRYFADVEAACIKQVGQTANPQAPQQQVQSYSSNLPACQGANTNTWSQCAGTKNYPTGDRYVGEWLNGKANGQGTYNSRASAATYTGQFAADTFSGAGTMTWTNGSKFVGQWKNDSAVSGTITYANGTTAAGTVRNAVFYAAVPQQQNPSAPPQQSALNVTNLKPGLYRPDFGIWGCGSKDSENSVCISRAQYKLFCQAASGITEIGFTNMTIFEKDTTFLEMNDLRMTWRDSNDPKNFDCQVRIELSGVVRGRPKTASITRSVNSFAVNAQNKILVYKTEAFK